ncbi:hypothetical protein F0L68_20160 [Solihabitans fulvus]|uniref:Uncharacterized protein n=1 Tax=Solihabitans fulvus TaxID=1892852 RepID=A0A5B2XCA1_9PSEU|nr:hypothetical protein [Solihabitans fulvus]KAA2260452.1 hypothetical protein F0L68_20160 [Solihabitans fulvus]
MAGLGALLPMPVLIAVLAVVLWPTRRRSRRVLRAWGVVDPTDEQAHSALRYLAVRRALYVLFLFVIGPLVARLLPRLDQYQWAAYALLAALLLGELTATLRPVRGGTRVATLVPRTWRDLVPVWAVVTHALFAVLALSFAVFVLVSHPAAMRVAAAYDWIDYASGRGTVDTNGHPVRFNDPRPDLLDQSLPWLVIAGVLLTVIAVYGLVWLAVVRPVVGDPQADAALRVRSARVMVGIGVMAAAQLLVTALHRATGLADPIVRVSTLPSWLAWLSSVTWSDLMWVLLVGTMCWVVIAIPMRPRALRAVRAAG